MLPVAGEITILAAPEMLLPALAAVLSGAIWGDHSSPISDTTILSSTGAGCHHMDHVNTQLPYTLFVAVVCYGRIFSPGFYRKYTANAECFLPSYLRGRWCGSVPWPSVNSM